MTILLVRVVTNLISNANDIVLDYANKFGKVLYSIKPIILYAEN